MDDSMPSQSLFTWASLKFHQLFGTTSRSSSSVEPSNNVDSSVDEPHPKRQKLDLDVTLNDAAQIEGGDDHSESVASAQDASQVNTFEDDDELNDWEEEVTIECEVNEAKWLRDHYGQASKFLENRDGKQDIVSIKFQSDPELFYFPKKLLTDHFEYFDAALRTNGNEPRFQEGHSLHFSLGTVSVRSFGFMLQWIQNGHSCHPWALYEHKKNTKIGCDVIDHVLRAAIAADYLLLRPAFKVAWHSFDTYIRLLLANMLLKDRRKLSLAHINLVQTHPAFVRGRSYPRPNYGELGKIMAEAAVRPFLQEFMSDHEFDDEEYDDSDPQRPIPKAGHENHKDWQIIIEHCKSLRDQNDKFAADVLNAVSETIKEARYIDAYAPIAPVEYEEPLARWFCDYGVAPAEHIFII